MQIKYVGPRPIISKSGIVFDNQFDDRYTYLNIVVQLIKALDKDSFENQTYQYELDNRRLNDQDILEGLQRYCGDLDVVVKKGVAEENAQIDNELKEARENSMLEKDEQAALIKNIEMMRKYRLQYTNNELLYDCAIRLLADYVKKETLNYIIVPMFQRFAAILRSVQDELVRQNFPIDTRMDIYEEDGKLMAKMEVRNR